MFNQTLIKNKYRKTKEKFFPNDRYKEINEPSRPESEAYSTSANIVRAYDSHMNIAEEL